MEGKKYRIIADILGDSCKSDEEHLFCCPFCKDSDKKKMSVNIEKNLYKCWICESSSKEPGDVRRGV